MIQMTPKPVCMTLTTVSYMQGFEWTPDETASRRGHYYYTCRLVPFRFDGGAAGSVSFRPLLDSHAEDFASEFNSTLINGKGRYLDGPEAALAVVNVIQGSRSVLHFYL